MLTLSSVQAVGTDLELFKTMLVEYQQDLGFSLCFQGFDKELADPFSKYDASRGRILLARWNWEDAGCGALTDLGDGVAEIKRVYVRPPFRRLGIARAVSEALLEDAAKIGYRSVRLDTLKRLTGAIDLYRSLGFQEIEPYNFNPHEDIVYMERPVTIAST